MLDLGTVIPGTTIYLPFHTFDSNDPSGSVTITGLAVADIAVYKDGGNTARASTAGFVLLGTDGIDEFGGAGLHGISIDLADNTAANFYEAGSQFFVRVADITVDAGTIRFFIARFRIGYPGALLDTTITSLTSQTQFILEDGSIDADAYNGCICYVHDLASAVQVAIGVVSDYIVTTREVFLAADPGIFTMAVGDNVSLFPPTLLPTTAGRTLDVLATGEVPIDFDTSIGTLGATQIEAAALNGKGDWNIGKTGYTAGPTAASFTTAAWAVGAINAAALAADAIQKIADGILPKKNTALNDIPFVMVLTSDHVTPATGLTVTATRSIDGGVTFDATTGTVTEATNGAYHFDASAADMNGAIITFKFSAATADDTFVSIRTGG